MARGVIRWLWFALGWVAVGVGSVGIVVPGLPTTVFFVIAAACFSRSSPRFEQWVLSRPGIGPMVRDYRAGLGMPRRAKVMAIAMIVVVCTISALLVDPWWLRLTIGALGLVGVAWIAWRVPTKVPPTNRSIASPGMATESPPVELGSPAPDFSLPSTTGTTVSLGDLDKPPVLVVAFICNHCPYVRHIESPLAALLAQYEPSDVAAVGISANDADSYPDDDLDHLAEQASRAGFGFPYLYDESQDVARAYGAVCTPDLFVFDADRRLAYRGEFDSTRPNSGATPTGEALRAAIDHVLAGQPVPSPHRPSVGCSIKWRSSL